MWHITYSWVILQHGVLSVSKWNAVLQSACCGRFKFKWTASSTCSTQTICQRTHNNFRRLPSCPVQWRHRWRCTDHKQPTCDVKRSGISMDQFTDASPTQRHFWISHRPANDMTSYDLSQIVRYIVGGTWTNIAHRPIPLYTTSSL